MLTIEGPVWLKPTSPAAELFPTKSQQSVVVCFLGSSAGTKSVGAAIHHQMADAPGRLSRALPLYLAEQVEFRSEARVLTLVPWVVDETAGFVLAGGPWKDEDAANYARQGETKGDYVVVAYIQVESEPWRIDLRLVRTIDGKCLGVLNAPCDPNKMETSLPQLSDQLLELLGKEAEVESRTSPALYQVPMGTHFPYYTLRLEQLLAVRCGGMEGIKPGFLSGEREIIDGNIQLCVEHPVNVTTRILLAQTLSAMKRVRPDIPPEFKDKITLLQREKPMNEPARGDIQRIFDEAFAT